MDGNDEILQLLRENNAMLREILAYVQKMQDPEYLNSEWSREIAFNVIGDIIAENLTPELVNNVKKQFGMK